MLAFAGLRVACLSAGIYIETSTIYFQSPAAPAQIHT